jgi:hypothetical protein
MSHVPRIPCFRSAFVEHNDATGANRSKRFSRIAALIEQIANHRVGQ